MSIVDQVGRIKGNIAAAYTALADMGAPAPATPDSAHLSAAVRSIPLSGSLESYLDGSSTEVYTTTKQLKSRAFYCDDTITSVQLPFVTRVGRFALAATGAQLQEVELPAATYFADYAFYQSAVQRVSALKVAQTGAYCFGHASKLRQISLPSVTRVSDYCFIDCYQLESAVFAGAANDVGTCAFENCRSLTFLDLGNTYTFVSNCFYGCSELRTIVLRNKNYVATLLNGAFNNSPFNNTSLGFTPVVYVPAERIADYQRDAAWSNLKNVSYAPIEGSEYE